MSQVTRIKIKIAEGEFEIEGNQQFVEKQLSNIAEMILQLKAELNKKPITNEKNAKISKTPTKAKAQKETEENSGLAGKFAEFNKTFRNSLSQQDLTLLAGKFIVENTERKTFNTSLVNPLFKQLNLKVTNPSNSLKILLDSGKITVSNKKGRTTNYQVSPEGEKYIDSLKR